MAAAAVQMLQKSLQDARKDLESTNQAIQRLTGRDPDVNKTPVPERKISGGPERRISGGPERRISGGVERRIGGGSLGRRISGGLERRISGPRVDRSANGGRMRAWSGDLDSPAAKRRDITGGRARLSGRTESGDHAGPVERRAQRRSISSQFAGRLGPRVERTESDGEEADEDSPTKPSLRSSVIATTVPPRPKADPKQDEASKRRNRRMFGFLNNTLQKFKDSEDACKQSDKERRRTEIVSKLEQAQELEKEAAAQERKELFEQRKAHKSKIIQLTNQVATVEMYEEWNDHDRLQIGFIKTKAKPAIFYLPAQQTHKTEELIKETRAAIEDKITARKTELSSIVVKDEPSSGQEEEEPMDDGVGGVGGEGERLGRRGRAGSDSGEASD